MVACVIVLLPLDLCWLPTEHLLILSLLCVCVCHLQRSKLEAHPMFDPVSEEELASDPAAQLLDQASEEAQKVSRNSGATYRAVFRRRETPRDSWVQDWVVRIRDTRRG